jgi:GTP-binding protein
MYDFLKYYDLSVIVVATKLDKIKRGQRDKQIAAIKRKLQFDGQDTFIPFSSETGEGVDAAWEAIYRHL